MQSSSDMATADKPAKIKDSLIENYTYQLIHEKVWDKLYGWYGLLAGYEPIPRKVVGASYNPMVRFPQYMH